MLSLGVPELQFLLCLIPLPEQNVPLLGFGGLSRAALTPAHPHALALGCVRGLIPGVFHRVMLLGSRSQREFGAASSPPEQKSCDLPSSELSCCSILLQFQLGRRGAQEGRAQLGVFSLSTSQMFLSSLEQLLLAG